MKHYAIVFKCDCGKEFVIYEIGVSSMGSLALSLVCVCGKEETKICDIVKLVQYANFMENKELVSMCGNDTVN